jgi:hypothetical protein
MGFKMRSKPATNKVFIVISLIILAFFLVAAVSKIASDPEVPFLFSDDGAQWIKLRRSVDLAKQKIGDEVIFRKRFVLEKTPPDGLLAVKALRTAGVFLDGRPVLPFKSIKDWKSARFVDLKDLLRPGAHELLITVRNEKGPAALLAYSKALPIATGPDWESSLDRILWVPAVRVGEDRSAELSQRFPAPLEALWRLTPFYIPLFVSCFLLLFFLQSDLRYHPVIKKVIFRPAMIRWLLLGAGVLLAANNIRKIPLYIGFDVAGHYQYINYILEKRSIPLATEGWQMFQSPFYYVVSTLLYLALAPFLDRGTLALAMRFIPLVCGILQVELVYRAVRCVFPERNDLQMAGTLVGGLLPMNLYISQTVGNEPLAGVLSAAAILMVLSILSPEAGPPSKGKMIGLGIVLGLAILTKISAVLLLPAVVIFLTFVMLKRKEQAGNVIRGIFYLLLSTGVVSGWYYLRNWIELGKPFVGGWDAYRKIVWWQDPGYRTVHDFISFGQSLSQPILSAFHGFWDSLYSTFWLDGFLSSIIVYEFRPPWNYDFMLSGALLSLLPAAGILLGLVIVAVGARTEHAGQPFSAYCIGIYCAAIFYLYATVPIYSTAKATYTLGLTPCYAVMCVTGLDILTRNRVLSAGIYALLICWAVSAYASYFVM